MSRFQWTIVVWVISLVGLGQGLHAQVKLQTAIQLPSSVSARALPTFQSQKFLFPKYIQQNPMGYAPLCRMELQIERQSPVGVWMRADGATYRQVTNPGLAYLRFKIPISGSK